MKYHNYHKHTMYSNLRTLDCVTKPIDYINRAKELGHDTYFTTEHGWQGNLFEAQTLCEANDIRCIYGTEAYYVDDITTETGRRAYHLILIAMNYAGRREINSLLSKANTDGFYYKPRMDREMVLSLTPENVVVTTACLAGRLSGEDAEKEFLIPFKEHFKDHFFLEVQCHVNDDQKKYNKMIMEYHKKYNIPIIHANDSHYITAADSQYRDLFLKAKGIVYEEETGMLLDYPDSDEIIRRYLDQGVLSLQEAETALENTLIFDHAESVFTDKEFKIPKIINGDSNKHLRTLLNKAWNIEKKNIPTDLHKKYEQEIQYEYKIVEDCGMADYFILDHYAVKRAVEKYNAVLTRSGRGSAVSFYINKLLGLTEVDRISAPITLYPTRFMSAERILSSRSLPD